MTTTTRALKAELKRAFARRIDAVEDEGLLIDLQRSLDDDAGFRSLLLDLQCSRDADALPSISGADLRGAVRAATAADALLETLKRRGAGRWREFLAQSGGCGTVREIARLTGMSTDAIHKGAQRRQLLAYKENGQLKFPLCQFEHGRVIPGLRELAGLLPAGLSDRAVVNFFLSPIGSEAASLTPIERLRCGDAVLIGQARHAARHHLEQAAT